MKLLLTNFITHLPMPASISTRFFCNIILGYYAGFIASAFTLGHLLTGYPWGYATDVIGRKPVVVIGLLSIAMFSVAFGFSPTFEWAVGSRCVCRVGLFRNCAYKRFVVLCFFIDN